MITRNAKTCLIFVLSLALLLTACVTEPVAKKNPGPPPDVLVKDGWIRWMPPSANNSAAYFAIENPSLQDDVLVGASTPRARSVEIHRIVESAGLKRMQRVTSVVVEPANRFEFVPGGYHLMLIGLVSPLKEGESIPVTLEFSRSGTKQLQFPVMMLVGGH